MDINFTNKKNDLNHIKTYRHFNFLVFVEIIKAISFIFLIIFSTLGFCYLPINQMATSNDVAISNYRAYWLAILIVFFFSICYSFYMYITYKSLIKNANIYLCFLCLNSWLNIKQIINLRNRFSNQYYQLIHPCEFSLSHYRWYKIILIACFIFYTYTVISCMTYPILLITIVNNNTITISNSYIFSIFSYFTELTNFSCYVYICFILFNKNKAYIVNRLSLLRNLLTYILVVMIVFWVSRIPNLIHTGMLLDWNQKLAASSNVQTIFLHFINPISFLILAIYIRITNKGFKLETIHLLGFNRSYFSFLIYPLLYAIYLYNIVYLVPYSVYGPLTNVNPNLIDDNSIFLSSNSGGNPIYYLGIILIWLVLTIVYLIIYFSFKDYSNKVKTKSDNYQSINTNQELKLMN